MPCDQEQEIEVAFNEATNLDALALALEGLGVMSVRREGGVIVFRGGLFRDGSFILNPDEGTIPALDALKRAYTKATALENADRFGWAVKAKAKAIAGLSRRW